MRPAKLSTSAKPIVTGGQVISSLGFGYPLHKTPLFSTTTLCYSYAFYSQKYEWALCRRKLQCQKQLKKSFCDKLPKSSIMTFHPSVEFELSLFSDPALSGFSESELPGSSVPQLLRAECTGHTNYFDQISTDSIGENPQPP